MQDYWMENAANPGRHVLVDLGYTKDAEANYNRLRPHVGARNFQRVGHDRMIARIPPRKVAEVLAAMPEITAGTAGYCWCTHGMPHNP